MQISRRKLENLFLTSILVGLYFVGFLNFTASMTNAAGITYISIALQYVLIILLARIALLSGFKKIPKQIKFIFTCYLVYSTINILRGVIVANNYWDFKFLFFSSITFTLISLSFFLGQNIIIYKFVISKFLNRIIWAILFLFPISSLISVQIFTRSIIPLTFLLLLYPYIDTKKRVIIISFILLATLTNLSFRTGIIKIILSISLLGFYYIKLARLITVKFIVFISLVLLPISLFVLGVSGEFNVFKAMSENEELEYSDDNSLQQNTNADTRTLLYVEVLEDLYQSNALIFGKSPSQGYRSLIFANSSGGIGGVRYSCEVNVLNILLYYGLVGFLLLSALLISIAYLGVFKSKNRLAVMFGFLLLTRFVLFFIEEFTQFNYNFFFFWITMGLVSSKKFRRMNERELKVWIKSFFYK